MFFIQRFGLVWILLCVIASCAETNEVEPRISPDESGRVDNSSNEFRMINGIPQSSGNEAGMLNSERGSYCTAVAICRSTILTVSHCANFDHFGTESPRTLGSTNGFLGNDRIVKSSPALRVLRNGFADGVSLVRIPLERSNFFDNYNEIDTEPNGNSVFDVYGYGNALDPIFPDIRHRNHGRFAKIAESPSGRVIVIKGIEHSPVDEPDESPVLPPPAICLGDSGAPLYADGKVVGVVSYLPPEQRCPNVDWAGAFPLAAANALPEHLNWLDETVAELCGEIELTFHLLPLPNTGLHTPYFRDGSTSAVKITTEDFGEFPGIDCQFNVNGNNFDDVPLEPVDAEKCTGKYPVNFAEHLKFNIESEPSEEGGESIYREVTDDDDSEHKWSWLCYGGIDRVDLGFSEAEVETNIALDKGLNINCYIKPAYRRNTKLTVESVVNYDWNNALPNVPQTPLQAFKVKELTPNPDPAGGSINGERVYYEGEQVKIEAFVDFSLMTPQQKNLVWQFEKWTSGDTHCPCEGSTDKVCIVGDRASQPDHVVATSCKTNWRSAPLFAYKFSIQGGGRASILETAVPPGQPYDEPLGTHALDDWEQKKLLVKSYQDPRPVTSDWNYVFLEKVNRVEWLRTSPSGRVTFDIRTDTVNSNNSFIHNITLTTENGLAQCLEFFNFPLRQATCTYEFPHSEQGANPTPRSVEVNVELQQAAWLTIYHNKMDKAVVRADETDDSLVSRTVTGRPIQCPPRPLEGHEIDDGSVRVDVDENGNDYCRFVVSGENGAKIRIIRPSNNDSPDPNGVTALPLNHHYANNGNWWPESPVQIENTCERSLDSVSCIVSNEGIYSDQGRNMSVRISINEITPRVAILLHNAVPWTSPEDGFEPILPEHREDLPTSVTVSRTMIAVDPNRSFTDSDLITGRLEDPRDDDSDDPAKAAFVSVGGTNWKIPASLIVARDKRVPRSLDISLQEIRWLRRGRRAIDWTVMQVNSRNSFQYPVRVNDGLSDQYRPFNIYVFSRDFCGENEGLYHVYWDPAVNRQLNKSVVYELKVSEIIEDRRFPLTKFLIEARANDFDVTLCRGPSTTISNFGEH